MRKEELDKELSVLHCPAILKVIMMRLILNQEKGWRAHFEEIVFVLFIAPNVMKIVKSLYKRFWITNFLVLLSRNHLIRNVECTVESICKHFNTYRFDWTLNVPVYQSNIVFQNVPMLIENLHLTEMILSEKSTITVNR